MITSFPIRDLRFKTVDAAYLSVAEAPLLAQGSLGCHVCKQYTTLGTLNNRGAALDIHSDCLFITNGRYYYVPHEVCRGLFSLSPLAYEEVGGPSNEQNQ